MKKFISMVMAAAMVVSLVPATAFAASANVTAKVVDAWEVTADQAGAEIKDGGVAGYLAPELQLTLNNVSAQALTTGEQFDITLTLDNAEWRSNTYSTANEGTVMRGGNTATQEIVGEVNVETLTVPAGTAADKVTVTIKELADYNFVDGDVICIPLHGMYFTKTRTCDATVKVTGDLKADPVVFASIVGKVLEAEVEDLVEVAEDEVVTLNADNAGVEISAKVNYLPQILTAGVEDLTIKISKGFEFVGFTGTRTGTGFTYTWEDEDELVVEMTSAARESIVINDIQIAATTAKPGDVATLKVYADGYETASVDVAKVIDHTVVMELVDPDEDVPEIWSGVDVANSGLTVNDSHVSLEVKIYETFPGAWNMNKAFTLSLPEGVYVVDNGVVADDVNETFTEPTGTDTHDGLLTDAFTAAYVKGEQEEFDFRKYAFENTRVGNDAHEMTFTLTLVADPDFEGDVVLKLEGAAVDTQEVTIAKFVRPWTVKAEQNDVIIDYRYTAIDTPIVVTEAEAGLWEENLTFAFAIDEPVGLVGGNVMVFENDAEYDVNEGSDMVVTGVGGNVGLGFEVDEESEDEAAEITISEIELFMQRNIPAGAYDLTVTVTADDCSGFVANYDKVVLLGQTGTDTVATVNDYSNIIKEAFINVVTAGRDQSDSSFTTTVVVPVGETTMIAGETTITLDVPAYINANGYIMVPVRAVANALGIANDCVQWNQAAKTVIIMYGDRLITMTAGSSVIYVGGAPLPSTSSVEIVDGRAFLGLRDLANALGVKSIAWDPVAKVGTLNPKA